jgi:RimJ/RimL family protein N-acetyltransferase
MERYPLIEISRAQLEMLTSWFLPEAPGPLVAAHVIRTGFGHAWVDRWPDVRTVIAETNYNYIMVGDPTALDRNVLAKTIAGFVAAPPSFVPLLESAFPNLLKWPRIIGLLPGVPVEPSVNAALNIEVRRLSRADAEDLEMLSAESIWVVQTWGGGKALAQSGYGWGAWVDGTLASVACTFFLGNDFEDIGVVTEVPYRGNGLSTKCVYELCRDIMARGRRPTWATSTDNIGSWRVAEKLGFVKVRDDWLYVVGREVPKTDS